VGLDRRQGRALTPDTKYVTDLVVATPSTTMRRRPSEAFADHGEVGATR
jgi:hypothetical protein